MDILRRLVNRYDALEKNFLILVMAILVLISFAQVVTRYVLGTPLFWSEELAKYIFVWLSWLGVSAGIKTKEHIQVLLLPDWLHKKGHLKIETGLHLLVDVLWCFTSFVVLYYGAIIVSGQMQTGVYGPATGIPMWMCYLSIPVASFIVCVRLGGEVIIKSVKLAGMFRKGAVE